MRIASVPSVPKLKIQCLTSFKGESDGCEKALYDLHSRTTYTPQNIVTEKDRLSRA